MAGSIIDVTDTTFQAEVLESETPVLVDFWAPWCGPCRVIAPILEEIAAERDDLRIVKLNIDENMQTPAEPRHPRDPDDDPLPQRRRGQADPGTKPRKRLEAELEPALGLSARSTAMCSGRPLTVASSPSDTPS